MSKRVKNTLLNHSDFYKRINIDSSYVNSYIKINIFKNDLSYITTENECTISYLDTKDSKLIENYYILNEKEY